MTATDRFHDLDAMLDQHLTCPFCGHRLTGRSAAPDARDVIAADEREHHPGCPWLITDAFASYSPLYGWDSIGVIARRLGVPESRLYNAIKAKRVEAVQIGRAWYTTIGNALIIYRRAEG